MNENVMDAAVDVTAVVSVRPAAINKRGALTDNVVGGEIANAGEDPTELFAISDILYVVEYINPDTII